MKHVLLSLVAAAFLLPLNLGRPVQAQDAPEKLNHVQKREADVLRRRFRAERDTEARMAIIEEAKALAPQAVAMLSEEIGRQVYPMLNRYRQNFYRQATRLAGGRFSQVDPNQVAEAQEKIRTLSQQGNLSEEQIVNESTPALEQLKQLFIIGSNEVLEAAEPLQKEREALLAIGRLWESCIVHLWEQSPESEHKPKEAPSFAKYLEGEEMLGAGMAMPMEPRHREVMVQNSRIEAKLDPEEARCIADLNLRRMLIGLNPLQIDLALCDAARDHSKDMQEHHFFAHESPLEGKKTPADRARRFGTTAGAENIYMGRPTGLEASEAWWTSPGHHANMLGLGHRRVGVGRFDSHWTQKFGR